MIRISPVRLRARLGAGLVAGAILAIGVPLAASAHVEVDPGQAPAGATTPVTFSFAHGCDGSPTRSLSIAVPKGVGNVTPVVQGGWSIHRTLGANDVPTSVTFTADTPVEQGLAASVSMNVLFDSAARGTRVAFPVTQTCVTGATSWTQVPAAGQDAESLEHPAPAVRVGEKAAVPAHGAAAAATQAAADSADPAARWLAAGGLAAGVAALAVSITAAVRRRSTH